MGLADDVHRIAGGCLCGKVRFEARGEPLRVGVCHCLDCRKFHGAPFWAAAKFAHENVSIHGETHDYQCRHFCPHCGSSVFAKTDEDVEIYLGALDEPNLFTPSYELWTIRRESWLSPIEGATQYERDRP